MRIPSLHGWIDANDIQVCVQDTDAVLYAREDVRQEAFPLLQFLPRFGQVLLHPSMLRLQSLQLDEALSEVDHFFLKLFRGSVRVFHHARGLCVICVYGRAFRQSRRTDGAEVLFSGPCERQVERSTGRQFFRRNKTEGKLVIFL